VLADVSEHLVEAKMFGLLRAAASQDRPRWLGPALDVPSRWNVSGIEWQVLQTNSK
jgi:hypothetical protein